MKKLLKMKADEVFKAASEKLNVAAQEASEKYNSSEMKGYIDKGTRTAKSWIDETGVTGKLNEASNFTGETLDTLTGAKIMQLIQERMVIQEQYNDVLATKLEEALQRIGELEKQVKLSKKNDR